MSKGKGGAPEGNQNAAKGRRMARVLESRIEQLNKMRDICDALINRACEGDLVAIKEVFDRIDGKARQQAEITGTDGSGVTFKLSFNAD